MNGAELHFADGHVAWIDPGNAWARPWPETIEQVEQIMGSRLEWYVTPDGRRVDR